MNHYFLIVGLIIIQKEFHHFLFRWRKPTSRVEKLQDLLFSLSLQAEAEEILELLNSTVSFCPRDIILDTERVFWGPGGRVTELLWRKMKLWI